MVSKNNNFFKAFIWAGIGAILLAMALMGGSLAHGMTSGPRRTDNSLGVLISEDNPFTYNMGIVAHGEIITDAKGREYTAIRFAPYGVPVLMFQDILLCDNQADSLMEHKLKVVVLTYERRAHTMANGVGCHELMDINEVKGQ